MGRHQILDGLGIERGTVDGQRSGRIHLQLKKFLIIILSKLLQTKVLQKTHPKFL